MTSESPFGKIVCPACGAALEDDPDRYLLDRPCPSCGANDASVGLLLEGATSAGQPTAIWKIRVLGSRHIDRQG